VNLINNKVIFSEQYVVQQDKSTLTNVWGRRKAPQPPGDKKASSNFDWMKLRGNQQWMITGVG